jgi:hypothetical protein
MSNEKYSSFAAWILVVAFIIAIIMQSGFMYSNPTVAMIDKNKIKASDVQKFMSIIIPPDTIDPKSDMAHNYKFSAALELLRNIVLIEYVSSLWGLIVSDEAAMQSVYSDEKFYVNGKFSNSSFLSWIGKHGITRMDYIRLKKCELLQMQLSYLWKTLFVIPNKLCSGVFASKNQKRNGRWCVVDNKNVKVPRVSEKELLKFYEDNRERFAEKEKLTYRILICKNVNNSIIRELKNSKDLDEIAKKHGLVVAHSDRLDKVDERLKDMIVYLMPKMKLELNENSELLSAGNQFVAFRLIEVKPGYTPPFSEIKNEVRAAFIKDYVARHVRPSKWRKISLIYGEDADANVPELIAKEIFKNPSGKMRKHVFNDNTYFLIVDEIINNPASKDTQFEDAELFSSEVARYVDETINYSLLCQYAQ